MSTEHRVPEYILISQVFPPAVGGSGVLLENVYSRVGNGHVTALVNVPAGVAAKNSTLQMKLVSTRIDPHAWGLFDPLSWWNQVRLARALYRLGHHRRGIVHCGRAQPEAIPAWLASQMLRGPKYLFWAHGEDIAAAFSSRQFTATMQLVYRGATAVIANSHNTARLVESTGWQRGQIHVVYPGVDGARFHPRADDGSLRAALARRDDVLLLSVARLQKRKGHDLVLRALAELRRETTNLRYVIVGDGSERANLTALASSLKLDDIVHFAGQVSEDRLPAYFAACDVFVLPTHVEQYDFEGFGIVYLEAAASGKPSIGGRNGGVPEAIVDGRTGILVSGNDVAELVAALRALCSSERMRAGMGEAGRVRALRDFTWAVAAQKVSHIHEMLSTW